MPERMVRGVRQRFAASALNYRALRLAGGSLPRIGRGWMPWLGLDRYPAPPLPGPEWVRVRPILSGICGTDMALLTGRASAILSPFASFPAVLGHEVLGSVAEVGGAAAGVAVGQRVVLDPLLGCAVRGLPPCRWCVAGQVGLCERTAEGAFAPAPMLGFCRDLPGGWSEELVAHASQLHPVPDGMPDETAALVEPFSVALHGVLAAPFEAGERVLVVGGGTMGLCAAAALRMVAPAVEVTLVARHPAQRQMAQRLGVGAVATDALEAAVERTGARRFQPLVGTDVLIGGFDRVYDCVGSAGSLDAALRTARPGGRVVVLGGPGEIAGLDWTLVWTRELRIVGSYVYGREESIDGQPHTMDVALRLLADHPELPVGELITHRFDLGEWRMAMAAALDRRGSGALKIVFGPGAA